MEAPRILLIRTSALGDIVHALPALTALRRHLPEARIAWAVEKAFAPLLQEHPDLDEVLIVNTRAWRKSPFSRSTWHEMASFVSALDRFGTEIALDLMGNFKGVLIAMLSLSDERIGLARRWRREPASAAWLSRTVAARGQHAVEHALSVAEALDLPAEPADFGSERLGGGALPVALDGAVLLHPGTAWPNKTYPAELWGEVARLIGRETGLRTLVSAGPGESTLAERVLATSGGHAAPLEDGSLLGLVPHLRAAALVLGGDTGPVHLAHALGAPVLCVMGPTDPERNGPYAAPEHTLWHRLPCSFCHERLDSVKACLLAIPPERVARRAMDLLEVSTEPIA